MKNALARSPLAVDIAAMLTGSQIRAARALLKWSGHDLAAKCGVSYPSIQRAEKSDDMPNMQAKNLLAIKSALEQAGVIFLAAGDVREGGPGVRLR